MNKMLAEDNKDYSGDTKITNKLCQELLPLTVKILSKAQSEKFLSTEENIQKMKSKLFSLDKLGEQFKGLKISYCTMVEAGEMYFNQSERSEDINVA